MMLLTIALSAGLVLAQTPETIPLWENRAPGALGDADADRPALTIFRAMERIVEGLLDRRFDLGLVSLPIIQSSLTTVPLFDEELLVIRPSADRVGDGIIATVRPSELAKARFLLFPKESNMRAMIDRFFRELEINPRVTMEADDTEVIKRLVESGFGYSILPQFALSGRGRRFQKLRVAGHKLVRQQALAMPKTGYPRALTLAVADFLQSALSKQ